VTEEAWGCNCCHFCGKELVTLAGNSPASFWRDRVPPPQYIKAQLASNLSRAVDGATHGLRSALAATVASPLSQINAQCRDAEGSLDFSYRDIRWKRVTARWKLRHLGGCVALAHGVQPCLPRSRNAEAALAPRPDDQSQVAWPDQSWSAPRPSPSSPTERKPCQANFGASGRAAALRNSRVTVIATNSRDRSASATSRLLFPTHYAITRPLAFHDVVASAQLTTIPASAYPGGVVRAPTLAAARCDGNGCLYPERRESTRRRPERLGALAEGNAWSVMAVDPNAICVSPHRSPSPGGFSWRR
jgi:hypothetical protein